MTDQSGYKRHGYSRTTRRCSKHARYFGTHSMSRQRLIKKINAGEINPKELIPVKYKKIWSMKIAVRDTWGWRERNKESIKGGYPTHGCVGVPKRDNRKKYNRAANKWRDE